MTDAPSQQTQQPSSNGQIRILTHCSPERIRLYSFDNQFGTHAHYKSLYTRRESLEEHAAREGTNVTLAVADGGRIIGFGVLAPPSADERWARLQPQVMIEVKAIEICRDWRSRGLARELVGQMLSDPKLERKIVYFVGYSWTWDLDGTGLTAQQYRKVLIDLFEPFGFQEFATNEPNICLKPENIFMGRIGDAVDDKTRTAFKWMLFDLSP
jgi:acetoin utilization protein AcuA